MFWPFILIGVVLVMAAAGLFAFGIQNRSRTVIGGSVALGLIGALLAVIGGSSIVVVEPSQRLVTFNRISGNLGTPREPGIHIINPLTTDYWVYDMSRQTYTMSATFDEGNMQGDDAVDARTSGGQEVSLDVTIIYRINEDRVNDIHINWPNDRYRDELIRPLVRSVVRDAVSLFPVESVYQERTTIDNQITEAVAAALEVEGFALLDILVRNITFTEEYANAIEEAQIAEVNIRAQEFGVLQAEQVALQREAEAEGLADARLIQARAEAEALQLIADVLAENPSLLEYEYIQNLADNIQVLGLPANSPFIFDLNSLIQEQAAEAQAEEEAAPSLIPDPTNTPEGD